MIEEFQEQQKRKTNQVRSIMDYTMGIVFFALGLFFLFYRHFGIKIMGREPSVMDYFIGALFIIYGSWRFYRGYKKNYYQ